MIYVCGRLLNEGKEMHGESEAVFRQTLQAGGRLVNLFFEVNESGFYVNCG